VELNQVDSALKQRLVGAVVLIALGVIFIPMLLNGPAPASGTRELNLEIPAEPEPPQSTRLLPVDASMDTPLPPPVTVDVAPRAEPIEQPAVVSEAPPVESGEAPNQAPGEPVEPLAAVEQVAPVPIKPITPASERAAQRVDGRYALQLGIYSNPDNLSQLKRKLALIKVNVYEESIMVSGKPATRLRAGPYADRAAAESDKAKITLSDANLPLAILNLASGDRPAQEQRAPAATSPNAPRLSSGWAVQVGIFSSIENANKLKERIIASGQAAFVSEISTQDGKSFRVRVGPELKRENANALKDKVNAQFGLEGFVVAHP